MPSNTRVGRRVDKRNERHPLHGGARRTKAKRKQTIKQTPEIIYPSYFLAAPALHLSEIRFPYSRKNLTHFTAPFIREQTHRNQKSRVIAMC